MGVDYYGYSCVRSEPIPAKYKPKISQWTAAEKAEFERDLRALSADERILVLVMQGISRDLNGDYVYPSKTIMDEKLVDEFYAEYEKNSDYIGVCWHKNRIYFKTPETQEGCAGRSYDGFGEFRQLLCRLYKQPPHLTPYIPPSTDSAPEYGFIDTEKCLQCFQGLEKVRNMFVPPSWVADPVKYGIETDHRFEKTDDDLHQDSWFFKEFYCVMKLGADGGIVRVS